jgi:hypothetical protein
LWGRHNCGTWASSLWRNPPKFGGGKGERACAGSADLGIAKRQKRATAG